MSRWYIMELGETTGPVTEDELRKLIKNKVVSRVTPIRTEGGKWMHADKVDGLFIESQKDCKFCGESILESAIKCKHCGEFLDGRNRVPVIINQQRVPKWSPGVAAVLSFLLPGLGQMYKGQIFNGMGWCVVTILGYAFFVIPGLVLHVCCVFSAAAGDPYEDDD